MLDKIIFLVALAGTAVVFADVLVRDGMLLAPVQRWLREWHKQAWAQAYSRDLFDALAPVEGEDAVFQKWARCHDSAEQAYYELRAELDNRCWWKPLWGCSLCVAGQWGFWGYLIRYHAGYSWRTIPEHLAFAAFTIIAAIIIQKWTRE